MSASDNDSDVSEEGILLKIEPKGSRDCSVSTSASNGCMLYFLASGMHESAIRPWDFT